MTNDTLRIRGSCHCGNIHFEVEWPDANGTIGVRACSCDFCQKHGGVWTSHPRASLVVTVGDSSLVSPYRFGTETAEFHVCARCGVPAVVTSEIEGQVFAVVNSNTFDMTGEFELSRSVSDFDGEDVGSRLERRSRNWIPNVRFVSGAR